VVRAELGFCIVLAVDATVSSTPRILIIEDEPGIVDFLEMGLRQDGYDVAHESDGLRGIESFGRWPPSLVILDVMLPGIDGIEVCRRLRAHGGVPIIMLTAKGDLRSRVDGFAAGADDYVAKPFRLEELLARVRAVLRRSGETATADLTFTDVRLSPASRDVTRQGRALDLTAREFDLLALFLRHPRQVLSKEAILLRVWGPDFYGDANVVEVYVRYLRVKLGEPPLIHTMRGAGYVLKESAAGPNPDG
jgi:two-component system, OmpR family, response regulator MprA